VKVYGSKDGVYFYGVKMFDSHGKIVLEAGLCRSDYAHMQFELEDGERLVGIKSKRDERANYSPA
jgi:hypothetical protein